MTLSDDDEDDNDDNDKLSLFLYSWSKRHALLYEIGSFQPKSLLEFSLYSTATKFELEFKRIHNRRKYKVISLQRS